MALSDNSSTIPASSPGNAGEEPDRKTGAGTGGAAEDMSSLLEDEELRAAYEASFRHIVEGEVVDGTVVRVTDKEVIVDINYKSEGAIPISEFYGESGKVQVKPGDKVSVFLEQVEDMDGNIVLSHEKAKRMKIWDEIERAYREQRVIRGRVIERIKGGLAVDIGVRAFLPGSQVDIRPVRNLDSLKGEELQMKVIKVNKKRGNIVLSRKAVIEEELERERKRVLESLQEGKVVEGTVKNITDYGVFIDLGGVDGLLHITDISWGRVNHPSEFFAVGQRVRVKVIKFDREDGRVSLGYKQLTDDPWLHAATRYPKGSRVHGQVVSITDYGAFVELEPGVEGLIHISEMSWNKRIKHPSKILNVGDSVEAVVLDIEPEARKISLGLKQTEPNPWEALKEKYPVGSIVTGRVRNLTDFGAFIEVEEGIDGLVHISDLSWNKRIKHPSEVLRKGDRVQAVVLGIDVENQKLSLGIKQLQPDKWEEFFSSHQVGDVVRGRIARITNFGLFVQLDDGIEGLCHVSELDEKRIEKPEEHFSVGQEVEMKIIKFNQQEKKIGLSIKALKEAVERSEIQSYIAQGESASVTLKERLDSQLKQMREKAKEKGAGKT